MASSKESCSPEKHAKQAKIFLKFLQNPVDWVTKLRQEFSTPINDGVFEQLRIQSDQFAYIYPLFEGAYPEMKELLMFILCHCIESSVSANLLANEQRVWIFLVASFNDDHVVDIEKDGSKRCGGLGNFLVIRYLIPYVSERTWKFVVQRCGLLEHLLAGMQKKLHTCHSCPPKKKTKNSKRLGKLPVVCLVV